MRSPTTWRFLLALGIVAALLLVRVLDWTTGLALFGRLSTLAAGLVPLGALLVMEGLMRRHAPLALKVVVALGSLVFVVASFAPPSWRDATAFDETWALFVYQFAVFALIALTVLRRDRAALSAAENAALDRIALSARADPAGPGDGLSRDRGPARALGRRGDPVSGLARGDARLRAIGPRAVRLRDPPCERPPRRPRTRRDVRPRPRRVRAGRGGDAFGDGGRRRRVPTRSLRAAGRSPPIWWRCSRGPTRADVERFLASLARHPAVADARILQADDLLALDV